MKIIKANAEYLNPTDIHPYAFMERVGRICYKSEDKISETSAVKFVGALFRNKHTAMLEHAHIYIKMDKEAGLNIANILSQTYIDDEQNITPIINYLNLTNKHSACYLSGSFRAFINLFELPVAKTNPYLLSLRETLSKDFSEIFAALDDTETSYKMTINTDMTVLPRNQFINDVNSLNESDDFKSNILKKHVVHTILFTCDRGVTHEFVRHRPASFAQESTRYCNYSNDKHGNEITVIEPCFWVDGCQPETHDAAIVTAFNAWYDSCKAAEKAYFKILENGGTPQQARDVLPTSVKTELVITATESEWQHIVNLRLHGSTGAPHPQMKEVMEIAYPMLTGESNNRIS